MRVLLVCLGATAIFAYSVLGALLMTRWELEAASGVSFDETVARMEAADEAKSDVPGICFAIFGVILSIAWVAASVNPRLRLPGWFSLSAWGAIVAFGAPAYFFLSFGNMNSVGDTFYDWNASAAFALVSPLYVLSGVGVIIAVTALIIGMLKPRTARQSGAPA